jgi:hypothetical protein
MSSPIENQTPIETVIVKDKKPKKIVLSAKLQKFMVFGYAFVQQLQAANLLTEDGAFESALGQLHLFDSVDEQTQFYNNFLEGSAATGKLMRKYIQDKNKPPKAEKKPRAPRKKVVKAETDTETDPNNASTVEMVDSEKPPAKTRKPRAKKSVKVVNDTENNIIGQLVAAAQNDEEPVITVEVPVVEAPAPKEKKPRKKAEPKPKVDAVVTETKSKDVEAEKKEKKPRKKAEAKAATATTPTELVVTNELVNEPIVEKVATPVLENEEEDEDEIHTREFVLNGVTYLIDDDNNVYSTNEDHDHIGVYDTVSKTIKSL